MDRSAEEDCGALKHAFDQSHYQLVVSGKPAKAHLEACRNLGGSVAAQLID